MPYDSDDRGAVNDAVVLKLGGDVVLPLSYEIQIGVMEAPASFSLRMGWGEVVAELIRRCPPKTPFELLIGNVPQFTGETDGYEANGDAGATTLAVMGRDDLAALQDAYVLTDTSFTETSIKDLVVKVLELAGVQGYSLVFDNEANRRKVSGVGSGGPKKQQKPPFSGPKFLGWSPSGPGAFKDLVGNEAVDAEAAAGPTAKAASAAAAAATAGGAGPAAGLLTGLAIGMVTSPGSSASSTTKKQGSDGRKVQAKVGERWLDFLLKELERAGLYLWAGPDRVFILSCPNRNQSPTYEILRRRGQKRNEVNVVSARVRNVTRSRHSEAIYYCHGGGKELGRSVSTGRAVDAEMGAYGYTRAFASKDSKAKTLKQAEYLARKALCDGRRAGWSLTYTLSGHTTPLAKGGQRAVWAADTIVHVRDDEFGIDANLYIATVVHRRGPETTTELTLMRPEDLVTAEEPQ